MDAKIEGFGAHLESRMDTKLAEFRAYLEVRLDAKNAELRAYLEERLNDQTKWLIGWMTLLVLGAAGLVIGLG